MWAKDPSYTPKPGYKRTREYRATRTPEQAEREKRRNAARQRALVRLAHEYPEEYRFLYQEELETALVDGSPCG